MQKQGCWKQWYWYHLDWYRYQSLTASGYRYQFEWYRYYLPTASWYWYHSLVPVPPTGFCPEMLDFGIFTHFSSTNLLQFVPYQKSTMESIQNNSKCGLESIKIHFFKLGLFTKIQIKKNEVRVLIFLTLSLQISSCRLLDPLGGRNGKKIPTKATPPCKP